MCHAYITNHVSCLTSIINPLPSYHKGLETPHTCKAYLRGCNLLSVNLAAVFAPNSHVHELQQTRSLSTNIFFFLFVSQILKSLKDRSL